MVLTSPVNSARDSAISIDNNVNNVSRYTVESARRTDESAIKNPEKSQTGNAWQTRKSTADEAPRTCSRNQAAFNIFLYMFGATQIPYAIAQMGWAWGAVFMIAMVGEPLHYLTRRHPL